MVKGRTTIRASRTLHDMAVDINKRGVKTARGEATSGGPGAGKRRHIAAASCCAVHGWPVSGRCPMDDDREDLRSATARPQLCGSRSVLRSRMPRLCGRAFGLAVTAFEIHRGEPSEPRAARSAPEIGARFANARIADRRCEMRRRRRAAWPGRHRENECGRAIRRQLAVGSCSAGTSYVRVEKMKANRSRRP